MHIREASEAAPALPPSERLSGSAAATIRRAACSASAGDPERRQRHTEAMIAFFENCALEAQHMSTREHTPAVSVGSRHR